MRARALASGGLYKRYITVRMFHADVVEKTIRFSPRRPILPRQTERKGVLVTLFAFWGFN